MLDRKVVVSVVLVVSCIVPAVLAGRLGYYEGGTIFWEARNPNNPREITVKFEFHFDLRKDSTTHRGCTQESIQSHKKLRTGGKFLIGTEEKWADYYCTHLDSERNEASGYFIWTYTLPDYEDTAQISYKECCWIPGIVNNGKDIGNGKGWNLVSTININHGDNTINSPPKSKTFAKYPIMSGCDYAIHISSDDANNDRVKCRWTKEQKGECNPNGLDICGRPYFDEDRSKPLAALDPRNCILTFGKSDPIPAGTYALMVMLEDYAVGSKKPISKTPIHFLMEVFNYKGDCRQPSLSVPDGICLAYVVGQEFSLRMVGTATASKYRITSIMVQGYDTEAPRRVADTESDYEITFSFTPTELRMYTICAIAFEDYRFASTQSCFNIKVVREEDMPGSLRVDRENSIPARNEQEATPLIDVWAIKFSRGITKGVFSPAYVTLREADGTVVWRVDATGPDAEIVNGDTLTFPNSDNVFLEFETAYTISLDEGVVQSDNGCSVKSKPSSWRFVTEPPAPAFREEPVCSVSSMAMYLIKENYDLGGYGPEIIHLRDPGCTALENGTHYIIFTSYGQCGTTFARNGTDFTYSNTVYIPEHPYRPPGTEVTRFPHTEVRFSCNIPAKTIKTLEFNPDPNVKGYVQYNGRADFLDALPETSLQLFENGNYQSAIRDTPVPLDAAFGSRLYFEGKTTCTGFQSCDAYFQACWATVSENPYDWPRHELIKDGCIEDSTLQMHDSGVSHKTRFSIDAFAFLGWRIKDTVYVHCNVLVCDSNDYSSFCKIGCFRFTDTLERSRRDAMTVVSSPGLFRRQQ